MEDLLFLDAQTKDEELRLTSFSSDITDTVIDFKKWVDEMSIKPDDLWYADVFSHISDKVVEHIASLHLEDNGCVLIHKPEKVVKNPYKRINPYRHYPWWQFWKKGI